MWNLSKNHLQNYQTLAQTNAVLGMQPLQIYNLTKKNAQLCPILRSYMLSGRSRMLSFDKRQVYQIALESLKDTDNLNSVAQLYLLQNSQAKT